MPSEPRSQPAGGPPSGPMTPQREQEEAALRLLAPWAAAYRSALAAALEEARVELRKLRSSGNGRASRAAGELGALALGPMDPERFASLLDPAVSPDPLRLERFEEAVAVLDEAVAAAEGPTRVEVGPDESLRDAVARSLEELGRAFGAVRALALLRAGAYRPDEHGALLAGLPFRAWRTLERELAPPLVVTVDGAALETVSGLAEFLDGGQKLVLLVREPCPPAPLARLIAPGVMVMQATETEALDRLASAPGPVVAALVGEGAARFVHGPATDDEAERRLEIQHLPEAPPRTWVGGTSPLQQVRELELLQAWTRTEAAPSAQEAAPSVEREAPGRPDAPAEGQPATPPPPVPTPADRLAAWLLSQADLDGADG